MGNAGSRGRCEEVRKSGAAWGSSGSREWHGEFRKSGVAWGIPEVGGGMKRSGSQGWQEGFRYFWAIRYFVEIPGYSGSPSYHKQPSGKFGGIRYSRDVRIDIGCLDPNPNPNPERVRVG